MMIFLLNNLIAFGSEKKSYSFQNNQKDNELEEIYKLKSIPSSLNKMQHSVSTTNSFCDFKQLLLQGQQKLLSYGQYCEKSNNKQNRKKVIYYTYSKL